MERSKLSFFKAYTIVLVILLGSAPALFAQFGLSSAVNVSFDDNIFNNYESAYDQVSELYLGASYDFKSKKDDFQLYYDGSLSYYRRTVDRTFHEHSVGVSYSRIFGKKINTTLNFGADFDAVLNRGDYTYLDTRSLNAYGNVKHYLGDRVLGQLGYRFGYIMYNEFSDLNYIDNSLFTRVSGFLPSKTTLSAGLDFGVKSYTSSFDMTSGRRFGMNGMNGMNGMYGNEQISDSSNGSIAQISVSMRAAQSIFDVTGLSIGARYQKNITDEKRYISSGTVFSGNDIFEDVYAYEGPSVDAMLTQRLPWNVRAAASISYQYKKYRNRPAYDLNQAIISSERIDKVTAFKVSLEKDFGYVGFGVYYSYVNNISNDLYYNFKNNVFTIGLNAGF